MTRGTLPDRMWTAFVPRRSTLRRPSDRAETVARWIALVLLVVSLPFLLDLGSLHAQDVRDAAARQRAGSHVVVATVSRVAPRAVSLGGMPAGAVTVTATWTSPDGEPHALTGLAYRGARVGDPWSAWVDATGTQVPPPRSDADAATEGGLRTFWTFLATALALLGLLGLVHRVLDRRRWRDWDEDWALFLLGRGRGVTG